MQPPLPATAANAAGKALLLLACLAWCRGDAAFAKQGADGAGPDAGSYLPASMHPKEDLFLAVFINNYDTKKLASFRRYADGCLTIAPEDLKEFNLKVPAVAAHGSGGICLEKMPGVTYRYDVNTQTIYLKVSDDARVPLTFDARSRRPAAPTSQDYPISAVFNYALFATGGTDNYFTNYYPQYQGASATVDGHIFSQYGVFNQSFQANSTATDLTPYLLRLDTSWFYENPETLVTYGAGDIISGSLNWTTSIRMGGIQIRRDFLLRPDLVTQPLPQFSGSAAVPSTVDVYANQARAFSQEITGGPFNINNIPLATGPDTIRVVLRDATGKETVAEYAYYSSTNLLAPGLLDYSLESGFARRFYGLYSDDYDGNPIGSGSFRYGVTPRITVEGHVEGGAGLANLGAGVDFGLSHYGVASFAFSGSEWNGDLGGQVYGSFETSLWGARFMARAIRSLGNYEDLASVTAPKCTALIVGCAAGAGSPYKSLNAVSLSVPLGFDPSTINFSYTASEDYDGNIYKIGTLTYSRPFYWDRSTISLNVFDDFEQRNSYGAYASLTFSWGKYTASAIAEAGNGNGSGNGNSYAAGGSFSRALDQEPGSYGYSLTALEGPVPYNSASASYRAPAFLASASVMEAGNSVQATASVNGSVAFLNGVHFANRIDNSFAVVDAGIPNARVLYENNPIGETDLEGTLLITSLRAHDYNKISIDPASLPAQADMPELKQEVVPAQRGGTSIHFKGNVSPASAVVSFKDDKGEYLPVGSEVWVNGGGTSFAVGYDGETYLTGLAATNTVTAKKPNGTPCNATFDFTPNHSGQVRIPDILCRSDGPVIAAVQTGGVTVRAKQ
ncbi:MAG: fimbria/pilus outer membrane usher protein [Rhodomicrobium sp.]